jgi:hypothetical protein
MSEFSLEAKLTVRETDLWRRFEAWLNIEAKKQFSSDDLRRIFGKHLQEFFRDSQHGIGGFFAIAVKLRMIREVGWIRSTVPTNHGRKIRLYEKL